MIGLKSLTFSVSSHRRSALAHAKISSRRLRHGRRAAGVESARTLAYAIITGLLAGIYAGLVLLTTQVFRILRSVAVAAATLAVARS
jgi:hypothetical protein